MQRATENLAIRTTGASAYTALVLHAAFAAPGFRYPGLVLAPLFAATVAVNWGLCRLNVKRRALQMTTFLAGGFTLVAFLLAVPNLTSDTLRLSVHAAEALFGLVTLGLGGYLLVTR
jgi:hypothetical protein